MNGDPKTRPKTPGVRFVTPTFLQVVGLHLRDGRFLNDSDVASAPPVAVVSAAFERAFWDRGSALGRKINFGRRDLKTGGWSEPWRRIVGVVGDVRFESVDSEPFPEVFLALGQRQYDPGRLFLISRRDLAPNLTAAGVPVHNWYSIDGLVTDGLSPYVTSAFIAIILFVGTLIVAVAGAYGATSVLLVAQVRPFAIRRALGGAGIRFWTPILGAIALAVAGGGVSGVIVAEFGLRITRHELPGVPAIDWLLVPLAVFIVVTVTTVAILVPAMRTNRRPLAAILREL